MSEQRMQYKVNMPPALYADVKVAAAKSGRTVNAEIVHRCSLSAGDVCLRDWFAGQALAGWIASFPPDAAVKPINVAAFAYEVADAMLIARQSQEGEDA